MKDLENNAKTLYQLAYHAYEREEFAEGVHFFRMLTLLECHVQKHWIGLGACLQMQRKFEEAVEAYTVAAVIDENNPEVHLNAAECLLTLGRKDQGMNALNSADHYISNNKNFLYLRSDLDFIRAKWNNNFSVLYHGQLQTLNFDSARQSAIEALRSERGTPSPFGKGDEEDRLRKVAASQNSKFEAGRGI